jgi:hypothetical protein
MMMFKCKRKLINPYNREDIPFYVVQSLISIYKKTLILYPNVLAEKGGEVIDVYAITNTAAANEYDLTTSVYSSVYLEDFSGEHVNPTNEHTDEPIRIENYTIHNVRESCLHVFERIRILVNGEANPEWFLQLTKNECDRFYHFYYIWWTRSNPFSEDIKSAICGVTNPFSTLNLIDENSTEEFYKSICLDVIEAMVYTGMDEYHCALGAKQVLTILTVVSRHARRVWPELFNELS